MNAIARRRWHRPWRRSSARVAAAPREGARRGPSARGRRAPRRDSRATTSGSAASRSRASRRARRGLDTPSNAASRRPPASMTRSSRRPRRSRRRARRRCAWRRPGCARSATRASGEREHRDRRVRREGVDEGLGAPDGGDADGEDHRRVEEAPMFRRSRSQRPGEDHDPGQSEAKRPRARVGDVGQFGTARFATSATASPRTATTWDLHARRRTAYTRANSAT